jgi:hypothetical protein
VPDSNAVTIRLLGPTVVTLDMWDEWVDPGALAYQGSFSNLVGVHASQSGGHRVRGRDKPHSI